MYEFGGNTSGGRTGAISGLKSTGGGSDLADWARAGGAPNPTAQRTRAFTIRIACSPSGLARAREATLHAPKWQPTAIGFAPDQRLPRGEVVCRLAAELDDAEGRA